MARRAEIDLYLRRAEAFIEHARYDWERGNYDLCLFHLEQAAQLFIKARLLAVQGWFPRTHFLRRLLEELAALEKGSEIRALIQKYAVAFRNLERAYITARYFYEEFFEEEVRAAFAAVEALKTLLWGGT